MKFRSPDGSKKIEKSFFQNFIEVTLTKYPPHPKREFLDRVFVKPFELINFSDFLLITFWMLGFLI